METGTRFRILEYLRKNQTSTAEEMSHGLGLTGANIRHHLGIMEKDELITVVEQRNEGRGRPASVYGVSDKVNGSGYQELAQAMMEVWLDGMNEEEQKNALRALSGRLAGEVNTQAQATMPRRLSFTVELLNKYHYQAHWEAGAKGPRIILGHCPYVEIIQSHPELCRMDAYFLENRLGLTVEQTVKLERSLSGLRLCMFAIG
jgi:predicted ArsR family transcriptional regulator